jgi:hypothetical protein
VIHMPSRLAWILDIFRSVIGETGGSLYGSTMHMEVHPCARYFEAESSSMFNVQLQGRWTTDHPSEMRANGECGGLADFNAGTWLGMRCNVALQHLTIARLLGDCFIFHMPKDVKLRGTILSLKTIIIIHSTLLVYGVRSVGPSLRV